MAELERRPGQDSSNSSKPPSQDGFGPPARPVALVAGACRARSQARRARIWRRLPDPTRLLSSFPTGAVAAAVNFRLPLVAWVEIRQVFDLPELRLAVTKYWVERRRCTCGGGRPAAWASLVERDSRLAAVSG